MDVRFPVKSDVRFPILSEWTISVLGFEALG